MRTYEATFTRVLHSNSLDHSNQKDQKPCDSNLRIQVYLNSSAKSYNQLSVGAIYKKGNYVTSSISLLAAED